MWISQDVNPQAPCATVTLDDTNLIAKECTKGIYNGTATLTASADTTTYTWTLEQSERDEGGSGSLMVIIYQSASSS